MPAPAHRQSREEARRQHRQRRIEEAADWCTSVVTNEWREAVADRASDYVTDATWRLLFSTRRRRRCRLLAEAAAKMLAWKKQAHQLVGDLAVWLVSLFTGDRIVRKLTHELASNIPLPYEAKVVAVARGTQIIGILLCVVNGDDLRRCQCFIDLALEETKTIVKKILLAAVDDWAGLAAFPVRENSPRLAEPPT
jgi:hypothetical protein